MSDENTEGNSTIILEEQIDHEYKNSLLFFSSLLFVYRYPLNPQIDDNYEPTEEEIIDYATYLGIDVKKEKEYLWIAKEGLMAPLPEPWKPCQTGQQEIYYFNFQTGESSWEHPCDQLYKKIFQEEKAKKATGTAPAVKQAPNIQEDVKIEEKLQEEISQIESEMEQKLQEFEMKNEIELDELAVNLQKELDNIDEKIIDTGDSEQTLLKQAEAEKVRNRLLEVHKLKMKKLQEEFRTQFELQKPGMKEDPQLKALMRSKMESEIYNIQVSEKARVDEKKSEIEDEVAKLHNTKQNEEEHLLSIIGQHQDEIRSTQQFLDDQVEEEIENYKLELAKEFNTEKQRITNKIQREIEAEQTNCKLEANKNALEIVELRSKREESIKKDFMQRKQQIIQEYESG